MEIAGILYVFPDFHTARMSQKIRCPAAVDLFRVSLGILHSPRKEACATDTFSCRTKLFYGAGALSALKSYGAERLFLVTDPAYAEDGSALAAAKLCGAGQFEIFDRVLPMPTPALAAEGAAILNRFRPDLLGAIGSHAIDCAKAMLYFADHVCPMAAVPIGSGSGGETTDFVLLRTGAATSKLTDARLLPDAAILDSTLLEGLSPARVAESGFEILTHAIESYGSKDASPLSDLLAREAFSTAFAGLPASFAGRQPVRLRIALASAMAGTACAHAGLGLCHALSYSLSTLFSVPHERLNPVLLPAVIDCNAYAAGSRYAQLARAAGMCGSTRDAALRNLKAGICRLRQELNLPRTLRQAGIPPGEIWDNLGRILESTLTSPLTAANPMAPEEFWIRRILEAVTGG